MRPVMGFLQISHATIYQLRGASGRNVILIRLNLLKMSIIRPKLRDWFKNDKWLNKLSCSTSHRNMIRLLLYKQFKCCIFVSRPATKYVGSWNYLITCIVNLYLQWNSKGTWNLFIIAKLQYSQTCCILKVVDGE